MGWIIWKQNVNFKNIRFFSVVKFPISNIKVWNHTYMWIDFGLDDLDKSEKGINIFTISGDLMLTQTQRTNVWYIYPPGN